MLIGEPVRQITGVFTGLLLQVNIHQQQKQEQKKNISHTDKHIKQDQVKKMMAFFFRQN